MRAMREALLPVIAHPRLCFLELGQRELSSDADSSEAQSRAIQKINRVSAQLKMPQRRADERKRLEGRRR
jgi:hypothetical protein